MPIVISESIDRIALCSVIYLVLLRQALIQSAAELM
jgi:hypothetical protein